MAKSRALVRLWAAVAALNLLVFAIIGVALYRGYDQQRAVATMTASNLSRVLEENLTRFIEKIDLTLRAVADEVARQEAAGAIDRDEMDAFLARHDVRLPESLGLRVVNAEGRIEYAVSNAAPGGAEVGDRDHFLGHRDNPLLGLLISKPVVGRMNKVPMVIFAHRRTGKGGSFRGIVHAAVSITALERVFRSVDLGENGVVGLWNPTPTLIARSAPVDATIPAVPSPTLRGLIEARAMPTTYHGVSPLDGIARVYSFRRVGSWPLFITVGIADQDYLMPWWREVRFLSLLALTFVLASLAAAWVIARGIRSQEAARAEAEAARRRSDLILASAADGICGLDTQGRVTFVNATARRLLGWADDAGLGWDFHAVAHHRHTDGRVYPAADCPVSAVLGGTGSMVQVDGEVYWRHDGTCFPVEYTVAAIVEGGEVKGAVNVFRDVGERQRIEGERVRTLAATTALGNILRLALEPLSLEQMLDAALDELLSLSWLKLERQACIFLLDSDHRTLRQVASRNLPPDLCTTVAVGHCLCGRAAVAGEVLFADCHDPRHDIHREGIPEHGHYCVPIGNPADRLGVLNAYVAVGHRRDPEEERFLSMVADTLAGMIQRKRTEETLQLSEERAKALLDAPADAAFLLGPDGTILAGNEAFSVSFAKPVDELVGTRFYDALKPDLAVRRRAAVEAVLGGGRMVETHDQREGREYDNRLFPVRDSHGAVAQVAVFSRDVTEQRRAARAAERALADLARSNEELQQFAYVASHDLRQPLRMVSSYLKLIEKRLGSTLDGETKEFLGFAVAGARRMDRLIVDLLEYSRAGRGTDPFAPVPLGDAVTAALQNLGPALDEAGAEVTVAADLPVVTGDAGELARLFQNLVGNAVKYRDDARSPRIDIGWRGEEDGMVVVWVRDNGTGIAEEDRDRAFRIFQRLVPSDRCEGSGIGLSICRKIVERHGGRIWIESVVGEGSTFLIRLPITGAEA